MMFGKRKIETRKCYICGQVDFRENLTPLPIPAVTKAWERWLSENHPVHVECWQSRYHMVRCDCYKGWRKAPANPVPATPAPDVCKKGKRNP